MAARTRAAETRDGVELTSLDGPLFDGAEHTKRDLVDYLDAVRHAILPALAGRALSVMRVRPGQQPFMQKNLPKYAPDWIARTTVWAEASHREIAYPLCDDRRTLLWLANQRAVEYHPALIRAGEQHADAPGARPRPAGGSTTSRHVVRAAMLIRRVLDDLGLVGAVKTSGSKGVHVFVPITPVPVVDSAAATRALAARAEALDPEIATTAFIRADRAGKVFLDSTRSIGATVVAAYSPRIRPGLPVSFPVAWADLPHVHPGRLHRVDRPGPAGRRRSRGRRRCRSPRSCRPSWSSTGTRSPWPGSRRCTRASAASAPARSVASRPSRHRRATTSAATARLRTRRAATATRATSLRRARRAAQRPLAQARERVARRRRHNGRMGQWVGRIIGVVLVLVGGLWTLQGFGVVGGSFMTGSTAWLVIGLVTVVMGVALLVPRRSRRR